MDTRKMLEFAYKTRDLYEKYAMTDKDAINYLRKEGEAGRLNSQCLFQEYGEIYEVIDSLKRELAYKEAKNSGRNGEKSRTSAAKKFLKSNTYSLPALKGFKYTDDGKILLCNGYALFEGEEIIGIQETEQPDKFIEASKVWPTADDYKILTLNCDDIADIKNRLSEAKSATGMKKASDILRSDDRAMFIIGFCGEHIALNSDYVLMATGLIGGSEWTVKCYGRNKGIVIEGECGRMLVLPVHLNKMPSHIDKEAE